MDQINHSDIYRVDLNLLVLFDAVFTEGSVTAAASRLNLGQPAVSAGLSRLRRALGDELFVRHPHGMRPTPRAVELAAPVRDALMLFQETLLDRRTIDLATIERTVRIGASDSFELLWMPKILDLLRETAPGLDVQVIDAAPDTVLELLDSARIDLALGAYRGGTHAHRRRQLYQEHFVCVFDAERLGRRSLDLDAYLSIPHVLGSPRADRHGVVDTALEQSGHERRLLATTPHFSTLPHYLSTTPCVATLPSRLAARYCEIFDLALCPVPLELDAASVNMVWHTSFDRDPFSRWLREQVLSVVS